MFDNVCMHIETAKRPSELTLSMHLQIILYWEELNTTKVGWF